MSSLIGTTPEIISEGHLATERPRERPFVPNAEARSFLFGRLGVGASASASKRKVYPVEAGQAAPLANSLFAAGGYLRLSGKIFRPTYPRHFLASINDLLRVIDRGRAKEGVTRSEWLRRLVEKNRGR